MTVARRVEPFGFEEQAPDGLPSEQPESAESREESLARARESGRLEGYRDGRARGRAEGESQVGEAVQTLGKAAHRLQEERAAVIGAAENDIVDLALAIAARILRREVEVDRDVVVRILKDALRRVSPLEEVAVRLNPIDYAHLKAVPGLEASLSEIRHLRPVEDRRVSVGGCLIETSSGAVDARLQTQLDEIGSALMRAKEQVDGGADPD